MADAVHTTNSFERRARIMRRAWELFRLNYNYPRTPFRSIGRHCFTACLKAAWAEVREIIRLSRFGVDALREAIARVSQPHRGVGLSTGYWSSGDAMVETRRQVRLYTAALALAECAI